MADMLDVLNHFNRQMQGGGIDIGEAETFMETTNRA